MRKKPFLSLVTTYFFFFFFTLGFQLPYCVCVLGFRFPETHD